MRRTRDDGTGRATATIRPRQGRSRRGRRQHPLNDVSPELGHQLVAWGFGEVYARPGLEPRDRQLLTLGMLTALGGCEPQLEIHIGAALNVGLTPQEIIEALLHASVYCGFPRALNATFVARTVFGERGLLPVGER
jgi:4-carboxymuconolactone decarboxylase